MALAQSLSISLVVEGAYDEANLVSLARRSAARYIRFVAPAVAGLILAAPLVLSPFGAEYVANGTTLLRLLLAGTMAKAVVTLYMGVERVRARVSRVLVAEAATFVLVSTGAVLGMRSYGLAGLGVAWLLAQLSVAAVVAPRLWRIIGGASATSRWRRLEEDLARGTPRAEAARSAGCSKAEVLRLTSGSSGTWSDLLDDVNGACVLIVDGAPGMAPRRLAERGAIVGVAEDNPDRLLVRRRLLDGANVVMGPTDHLLEKTWNVVCLDGIRLDAALVHSATTALAAEGRLLVIADNRWSPVRFADRVLRQSVSAPATRLRRVTAMLGRAGFVEHQVFGLLRSSAAPASSFNVEMPGAASEVLFATSPRSGRFQVALLRLFNRSVRAGWAAPIVPAWAVIASAKPAKAEALEVVGRIGYHWTSGARILLGEPPRELEKRYETAEEAEAEAMALTALNDAGLDIAPQLLGRPSPRCSRMTWCDGRSLRIKSLSTGQRLAWVVAAARLLGVMHEATRRPDGSVLVHDDFWLGNLLVRDGTISAVIDWGSARWGTAEVDAEFLVDSLGDYCHLRPAALDELRVCRDQALSSTSSGLLRTS